MSVRVFVEEPPLRTVNPQLREGAGDPHFDKMLMLVNQNARLNMKIIIKRIKQDSISLAVKERQDMFKG